MCVFNTTVSFFLPSHFASLRRRCRRSQNAHSYSRISCDPIYWIYFEEFVPRAILLWLGFLYARDMLWTYSVYG